MELGLFTDMEILDLLGEEGRIVLMEMDMESRDLIRGDNF